MNFPYVTGRSIDGAKVPKFQRSVRILKVLEMSKEVV
jgi:hypothetical protein